MTSSKDDIDKQHWNTSRRLGCIYSSRHTLTEHQQKGLSITIGRTMTRYFRKNPFRRPVISQRRPCKNLLFICFVGMILLTEMTESSTRVGRDKTPLIVTDDSHGGFRYFLRRPLAPSLTSESRSFQAFKFIKKWGNDTDLLLLGGKDHVYMIDSKFADFGGEISYRERLTWRTQSKAQKECVMMPGQTEELCENFIRFIELMENGELMVCGTNAYSPACRYYKREQFDERIYGEDSDYRDEKKCRDQCIVPHNPGASSVSLYTNTNDGHKIFAAAVNGFTASDPIIMRAYGPTSLSNSQWLKEPTFLKMVEYKDKVYVFFREAAQESESNMDGEVTYARVAQMCKNDPGGINVLAHRWTSFLKARLRCGYPGRQQYNVLTSVSDIVSLSEDTGRQTDIFYATFSTPLDWADSSISAVCAFSMEEVTRVFEQGRFFREETFQLTPISSTRNSSEPITEVKQSYPIEEHLVPSPRPGSCNLSHSPNALYFAKEHPLMYDEVMPVSLSPTYVMHGLRATQITVDINAGSSGNHVIYVGTDNGKVLRLRSMRPAQSPMAVLIETLSLETGENCLAKDCKIQSFHVSRPIENGVELKPSVFVAFTDFVVQFPVARCDAYGTQECCSVDPDCGWDAHQCVLRTSQNERNLAPTSQSSSALPEGCGITGSNERCACEPKDSVECENESDDILGDLIDGSKAFDLKALLGDSISSELRREFQETIREISSDGQRKSLRTELKEAVSSTVGLVLRNHNKEYCLPSSAVNHLTHVYPLLVREIELWHETALKKMDPAEFDPKCWTNNKKKCPKRASFSLPLALSLWEPLSKFIVNFSGRCRQVGVTEQEGDILLKSTTQSEPSPIQEICKDTRQPHCRAERCEFQGYAVDVKAFFRHANDSRQFLKRGDHLEPLWKGVNITLPSNESIRGHLEMIVSEDQPFLIDYSPVAEKVKIMFHYKPVKDCDLSDRSCLGLIRACDSEVEDIIDHWHEWVMRKLPHKMKKCSRQIKKLRRRERGSARRLIDPIFSGHRNTIQVTSDKCRFVRGQVGELSSQPVTKNIWLLIVSRCQQAGGLRYGNKIIFYNIQDLQKFFNNTCSSTAPSAARRTLTLKTGKIKSHRPLYVQPMVTPDAPFTIKWNGRITINYFAEETFNLA